MKNLEGLKELTLSDLNVLNQEELVALRKKIEKVIEVKKDRKK